LAKHGKKWSTKDRSNFHNKKAIYQDMHNTFATNLLQSITEFSAFIFEADRAHKSGNDMNVQRALDYAEAKGIRSEWTPQPPSNATEINEY